MEAATAPRELNGAAETRPSCERCEPSIQSSFAILMNRSILGATWNVQVVRGKMSTQCLWHACRALMVGILLMAIGASMATIGYYSNDFATGELRNNSTIRVKNEQRGLHLNNLSYMGPIIMGVGGE